MLQGKYQNNISNLGRRLSFLLNQKTNISKEQLDILNIINRIDNTWKSNLLQDRTRQDHGIYILDNIDYDKKLVTFKEIFE